MTTLATSFQSQSQLDAAISTLVTALNNGLDLDSALPWAQAAFDRAYDLTPVSYSVSTNAQVSGRFSNGDSFTVLGSNLLGTTSQVTQLNYLFANGISVVLLGNVTDSPTTGLSGTLTQATISKPGLGTINIFGAFAKTDMIDKVVWDIGSLHVEEIGTITALLGSNGSTYYASHSGLATSGLISNGTQSMQISGMSLDSNANHCQWFILSAVNPNGQ